MKQPCALIALNWPKILKSAAHNLPFLMCVCVCVIFTFFFALKLRLSLQHLFLVPVGGRHAAEVGDCEFKSGP